MTRNGRGIAYSRGKNIGSANASDKGSVFVYGRTEVVGALWGFDERFNQQGSIWVFHGLQ